MELITMGIFMCLAFVLGRYTSKPKVIKKTVKVKPANVNKDFKLDEATITMLENIDNYDGTSNGQKDIPEEV